MLVVSGAAGSCGVLLHNDILMNYVGQQLYIEYCTSSWCLHMQILISLSLSEHIDILD